MEARSRILRTAAIVIAYGMSHARPVNATSFWNSTRRATGRGQTDMSGSSLLSFAVEFARANGRNAVYSGFLVGGKYVARGHDSEFSSVRGLTVQGGLLFGYHILVGSARYGPHPDATRTTASWDSFALMLGTACSRLTSVA